MLRFDHGMTLYQLSVDSERYPACCDDRFGRRLQMTNECPWISQRGMDATTIRDFTTDILSSSCHHILYTNDHEKNKKLSHQPFGEPNNLLQIGPQLRKTRIPGIRRFQLSHLSSFKIRVSERERVGVSQFESFTGRYRKIWSL